MQEECLRGWRMVAWVETGWVIKENCCAREKNGRMCHKRTSPVQDSKFQMQHSGFKNEATHLPVFQASDS